MPLRLATSSYSGSARLSGAFAVEMNAVVTARGICGAYRVARATVRAWRGATLAARRACAARLTGTAPAGSAPAAAATTAAAGAGRTGPAVYASRTPGI